uniref:Uncharacterized protein n=1 Tax=Rhizophagus irregularis (strain DAOM 181602 / DAOM 197198 / MUCL 43194) TaxID=747089 RepID=U9TFI6_RHIID
MEISFLKDGVYIQNHIQNNFDGIFTVIHHSVPRNETSNHLSRKAIQGDDV